MAGISDLTPEQFQKIMADAFKDAQSPTGTGTRKVSGAGGFDQKEIDSFIKSIKDGTSKVTSFGKFLNGQTKALVDITSQLKEFDEAIEQTTDTAKIADMQAKRRQVAEAAAHENNKAMLFNFGVAVTKAAGTVTAGVGQFIKGLQGGGSGMDLATGMMTTGVDVATQATSAMGSALGTAGGVLATSTNPKLKMLGAAASIAGPLLEKTGEAAGKLAKFGIEVLSKEVEKTVKAFHTATASGAVFADGMTGLRNAANSAGLTVDQFADVLGKHSTDLASLGMGVTEGAKRVGGALNAGGTQMKSSLQKLGFGFEEQAGLVAETMKDMKGSSKGKFAATDQQVAEQTQKYAENLRTISAITGEDAKAKMKQVNEQANQLAFQQKLSKMAPEQQAAAKRAMANMSDIERKNFMDMVNFGSVINKEGAAAQAMSQGLTDSVSESYAAFQSGQLDDVKQREIAGKYADTIKTDMLNNEAIATAGAAGVGGLAQSLSESMGKELQYRNAWTEDAIKSGSEGVQAQKDAQDQLTNSVVGAEQAAQSLKLSLEKELTPAIGKFAEVSKAMLGQVQDMLKDLGIGKGSKDDKKEDEDRSWLGKKWDSTKEWLSKPGNVSGSLMAGGTGMEVAGAAASMTGVGAVGGIPLATIGAVMQGVGLLAGAMGYAKGGVATGPDEGYLTKLHGNELVVPLDSDGGLTEGTQGFAGIQQMMKSAKPDPKGLEDMQAQMASMMKPTGIAMPDIGSFTSGLAKAMPNSQPSGMLNDIMASMGGLGKDLTKGMAMPEMPKGPTDILAGLTKTFMPGADNTDEAKVQTDLLKQLVSHNESLISIMKENVSGTDKLLNALS